MKSKTSFALKLATYLILLRIEIFDDVAIVAYYASWKSDKRSAKTKNLSVYKKQGDNWT